MSAVPDISNMQQDGVSGLLSKAAEHSESESHQRCKAAV